MNADAMENQDRFPPRATTSPAEGAPVAEGRSPEESLAAAQAAVAGIVQNVQTRLQEVDVVTWARQHPWLAIGISAATGFVAATALS